jgi:hypothetical protein
LGGQAAAKAGRVSLHGRLPVRDTHASPGPAGYTVARPGSSGPSYSMYGRVVRRDPKELVPGPGAYQPKMMNFNPSFTLSGRTDGPKQFATPGPGAYDTVR